MLMSTEQRKEMSPLTLFGYFMIVCYLDMYIPWFPMLAGTICFSVLFCREDFVHISMHALKK